MPTTPTGRSYRAPLAAASLAIARVRARPSRGLVTALGIALAVASMFVMVASPTIAGDATLRRTLEEVPAGERSITVAVSVNSLSFGKIANIDKTAHSTLRAPGLGPVRAQLAYRVLATPDGTNFRLAGLDHLAEVVTLVDGRLPTTCVPTRCEVVVGNSSTSPNLDSTAGLEIVGHVALVDPTLLAGFSQPGANEVLLLGDGVNQVGSIAALSLIARSMGWVASIDPQTLRLTEIDNVLEAGASTIAAFSVSGVSVSLPTNALRNARSRSATAAHRATLPATQGLVLLVAFVLLAAAAARREHVAARRLLRQRGASRSALAAFTAAEAAWPAAVGLVIGVPLGCAATIAFARRWHLPASDIVVHVARVGAWKLGMGTLVLLVATALVMASAPSGADVVGSPRRWWEPRAIDGIGLAALCAGMLAVSRGTATPSALASTGDPLVALLPLVAALVVAWVSIRLVPLILHGVGISLHARAPLVHTALGEMSRRPILPLATAGFLAAATTLGVFSLGYRATLHTGAHDQAAFAVPFDVTLSEGPALVRPATVAPIEGWASIAPTARSTEVLRRGVAVRSATLTNDTVTLIGLDPATLTSLRGWRSDFGPPLETLPGLIAASHPPKPMGTPIPSTATSLAIRASGDVSSPAITAVISRRDGSWHEVDAVVASETPNQLDVQLSPDDAGGRLIGFRFGQPGYSSDRIQHHVGEGTTAADSFTATVRLEAVHAIDSALPSATPTPMAVEWSQLHSDEATITPGVAGVTITVALQGTTALVAPPTTPEMETLPAIVDPTTASRAVNGLVSISVVNNARRVLRVAAVATHFPGAPNRFAIVDRSLAEPALDLINPGLGTANETWIAVDHADEALLTRALSESSRAVLVAHQRRVIEQRLTSDPLSRFALNLFAIAALITGLLAAAALYLATLADAVEQAPLHRALAADGVAGSRLSRMVLLSALASAAASIALGTLGAIVLLRLVTRIIAVTATATVAVPPLLASLPMSGLSVALAIIVAPCCITATLAARSARSVSASDLLREFG